jgi:predicted dehydrogenase
MVGAGPMAIDYAKVLQVLNHPTTVVGRGVDGVNAFIQKTGMSAVSGGIEEYFSQNDAKFSHAIIATGVEALADNCLFLIKAGIKKILIEKPAGLNLEQITQVYNSAVDNKAEVYVAYNRRFYSSISKAKELIDEDGGLTSFHFEFTEWAHKIEPLQKAAAIKAHWFLANSTHVIDTAFFLGGTPEKMESFHSGSLSWHPSGSIYCGAGITKSNALFTYHSNWESAGRWGLELLTNKRKIIVRPLEELYIQMRGSIDNQKFDLDNTLDIQYKPGLYNQVIAFLNGDDNKLCSIQEHYAMCPFYYKMSNY